MRNSVGSIGIYATGSWWRRDPRRINDHKKNNNDKNSHKKTSPTTSATALTRNIGDNTNSINLPIAYFSGSRPNNTLLSSIPVLCKPRHVSSCEWESSAKYNVRFSSTLKSRRLMQSMGRNDRFNNPLEYRNTPLFAPQRDRARNVLRKTPRATIVGARDTDDRFTVRRIGSSHVC